MPRGCQLMALGQVKPLVRFCLAFSVYVVFILNVRSYDMQAALLIGKDTCGQTKSPKAFEILA